jgi:hypothetical protein
MTAIDLGRLAGLAFAEAGLHPPRSPGRRAASHLAIALTIPPAKTIAAARRAVESYGAEATQRAALALLDKFATATKGQTA